MCGSTERKVVSPYFWLIAKYSAQCAIHRCCSRSTGDRSGATMVRGHEPFGYMKLDDVVGNR